MSIKQAIFTDRIVNLSITRNLARLDLAVLEETPKTPQDPPKFVTTHQLVMPVESLLALQPMLAQLVQKMVDDGVLTPRETKPTDVGSLN